MEGERTPDEMVFLCKEYEKDVDFASGNMFNTCQNSKTSNRVAKHSLMCADVSPSR